jgi:hypothetical protein
MLKIINKTPHPVTVAGYTCEPDAEPARCTAQTVQVGDLAGIPLFQTSYGDVYGLPPERDDTVYIVSAITAQAVRGKRRDCYIVAETIRDDTGRIVGCRGLAQIV